MLETRYRTTYQGIKKPDNQLIIRYFCREDRIRTCDHMTPSHVRYRAALLPELYKTLISCKYRFIPRFLIFFSKTTASLLEAQSIILF